MQLEWKRQANQLNAQLKLYSHRQELAIADAGSKVFGINRSKLWKSS